MNTNTDRPEFWGCRTFYSQEEAEEAHKAYRERNKGKSFGPGKPNFIGLTIIMSEDARPQSKEAE